MGYIDRTYTLDHDAAASLDAKLRLVETMSDILLAACLCLALCLAVLATCVPFEPRKRDGADDADGAVQ